MVKKIEDMCNRLDTIPACDGRTVILPRHSLHYASASLGKNNDFRPIPRFISQMIQDRAIVTMEGE